MPYVRPRPMCRLVASATFDRWARYADSVGSGHAIRPSRTLKPVMALLCRGAVCVTSWVPAVGQERSIAGDGFGAACSNLEGLPLMK
jgi:hypothetical protein